MESLHTADGSSEQVAPGLNQLHLDDVQTHPDIDKPQRNLPTAAAPCPQQAPAALPQSTDSAPSKNQAQSHTGDCKPLATSVDRDDALDLETGHIRVRCSSCGLVLFASAPRVPAIALVRDGSPPSDIDSSETHLRDASELRADCSKACPNCQEQSLYDDGIISHFIDAVELYNLRVSGSEPTLCIDCRHTMCDFSAIFLAAIHLPPQSGPEVDLTGIDSGALRKLSACRGNLVMVTEGGVSDDTVTAWAVHASWKLRDRFKTIRLNRYLRGGITAFKRAFPGLFSPPVTAASLPACILSRNPVDSLRNASSHAQMSSPTSSDVRYEFDAF
jgi:hypothetical protein